MGWHGQRSVSGRQTSVINRLARHRPARPVCLMEEGYRPEVSIALIAIVSARAGGRD